MTQFRINEMAQKSDGMYNMGRRLSARVPETKNVYIAHVSWLDTLLDQQLNDQNKNQEIDDRSINDFSYRNQPNGTLSKIHFNTNSSFIEKTTLTPASLFEEEPRHSDGFKSCISTGYDAFSFHVFQQYDDQVWRYRILTTSLQPNDRRFFSSCLSFSPLPLPESAFSVSQGMNLLGSKCCVKNRIHLCNTSLSHNFFDPHLAEHDNELSFEMRPLKKMRKEKLSQHSSKTIPSMISSKHMSISGRSSCIVDVWSHNLEEEFERIRHVLGRFRYIAMDTEFPGIVARPADDCLDYNYKIIKCNVDLLNIIQLGITFANETGCSPTGTCTWQFNFKFDLSQDMYAQDSIDFLRENGMDFPTHQKEGIDLHDFGKLIKASGLVMNDKVKWIAFHGCYDFAYLLKILTCAPLPDSETLFLDLLHTFFPFSYDIKYMFKTCRMIQFPPRVSLQNLAEHFKVKRVGKQHQAGSDSLVTCQTFFRLMETYFDNLVDDGIFSGVIYGLSVQNSIRKYTSKDRALSSSCSFSSFPPPPPFHRSMTRLHHSSIGSSSRLFFRDFDVSSHCSFFHQFKVTKPSYTNQHTRTRCSKYDDAYLTPSGALQIFRQGTPLSSSE